jgi:hypothetical protein
MHLQSLENESAAKNYLIFSNIISYRLNIKNEKIFKIRFKMDFPTKIDSNN